MLTRAHTLTHIQGPRFEFYICGLVEVIFFKCKCYNNPTSKLGEKNNVFLIEVASSIDMWE